MNDERGERKHHTGQSSRVPVELEEEKTELLYVRDEEKIQPFGA